MKVMPDFDFADNGPPDFFLSDMVTAVVHDQEGQRAEYSTGKDRPAGRMVSY